MNASLLAGILYYLEFSLGKPSYIYKSLLSTQLCRNLVLTDIAVWHFQGLWLFLYCCMLECICQTGLYNTYMWNAVKAERINNINSDGGEWLFDTFRKISTFVFCVKNVTFISLLWHFKHFSYSATALIPFLDLLQFYFW